MLQPFDIFFKVKRVQGHMGRKSSIYSRAAAGIGPTIPDVRREVCHRGRRPGDDRQQTP